MTILRSSTLGWPAFPTVTGPSEGATRRPDPFAIPCRNSAVDGLPSTIVRGHRRADLALRAVRDDYDNVVCLLPPPTRSARATGAPHEPWTAKVSTARARSVAAAAAPRTLRGGQRVASCSTVSRSRTSSSSSPSRIACRRPSRTRCAARTSPRNEPHWSEIRRCPDPPPRPRSQPITCAAGASTRFN